MTKPAISLRRARATDLPALLALERSSFNGDQLSVRQFRYHIAHPRNHLLVAEADGRLAGVALVFLRKDGDLARLYSIATAIAMRGRGLGAALLQASEQLALDSGARRLRLEVRSDNTSAIGLYQAHGYKLIARRPGYYEDGCEALQMEKQLCDSTATGARSERYGVKLKS